MKRRRLSDLYVRGRDVTLNDGAGDSVTVWLQKLNGVERESCLRRANAAKARFMIDADDESSDTFHATYAQVREMQDREATVGLVISEDLAKYRQRIEAELSSDEDTWGKEGYLQGLIDAWIGDDDHPGLAATQAEDPDDPEVKRVLTEIERFENEVNGRIASHADSLRKDWVDIPDEPLWRRAAHRVLELRGTDVFNREFERQQIFYAVREPDDRAKRYFGTLQELDDLDEKVLQTLLLQYSRMVVDQIEGKDSRATRPSSTSSDHSSAEEAQTDSGREAVNA